jgi:uncharacterized protein (TIGR02118 family)
MREEAAMVKLTIMHPSQPGLRFDRDYFLNRHIPMLRRRWASHGMLDATVVRGLGGISDATYHFIATATFRSFEDLQQALRTHGKEIFGDVASYADAAPILYVSPQ